MQWLISQIWIALGAAGVLGILFGMAFRGLLTQSGIRRAHVDRDIAKTELDQTRLELDELYAAQRKRQKESADAVSGDDKLSAELSERETRIASLSADLTAAQNELADLKTAAESDAGSNIVQQAGAALAGAGAATLLSKDDEALKERNTWLEERVATLEAEISAVPVVGEVADTPEASEADEDLARLRWRNRYLESRVAYFEGAEGAATAEAATEEETDDTEQATITPITGLVAGTEEASEPEAVQEGTAESEEDNVTDEAASEVEEAASEVEEAASGDELETVGEAATGDEETEEDTRDQQDEIEAEAEIDTQVEVEEEAEPSLEDADNFEEIVADVAGEAEAHPSDAVLKELIDIDVEAIQPEQVESSDDDDDLAKISGIGPKIAELLNELGIYTYQQVAGWTPENAAWVDQHLSFTGRVARENWIEQAEELLAAVGEAEASVDA